MRNGIVRNVNVLLLAVTVVSAPLALAQRKKPVPQPQAQQPTQAPQDQSGQPQSPQGTMPMQAAQAPASACANKPLCYEANDFVATVTEFRTSTDGRGSKILDALVHFQNKTNQPISLGYVDGSGGAIDDMGNRFLLNAYGGGVRGMGIVAGNNMDPKFTLPAGGGGDSRFEMWWAPYGKLAGVNYEIELSIREMNRVEGNQWTLGDESLIHYQGLANGMGVAPVSGGNYAASGAATGSGSGSMGSTINSFVPGQTTNTASGQSASGQPMNAYSAQPCAPGATTTNGTATNVANAAGAQNQNANNAITNASQAISNLGSIFGRKKNNANANANPNTANTANAAVPCTPVNNVSNGSAATPAANAAMPRTAGNAVVASPAANTKAGAIGRTAGIANTAAQRGVVTTTNVPVNQQAPAVITKTSLKQPVPATNKTTTPPAKKPATTPAAAPATTNGTGGSK